MRAASLLFLAACSVVAHDQNSPPNSNAEFMKLMYDAVFGSVCDIRNSLSPGGFPLGGDADKACNSGDTFLAAVVPALPIGQYYGDMATPVKPGGNQNATIAFSMLTDIAPRMNAIYGYSEERKLTTIYQEVVNAATSDPPVDPADQAMYNRARDILFSNHTDCKTTIDPTTFKPVQTCASTPSPSPAKQAEMAAKKEYQAASATYKALWLQCNRENWTNSAQTEWVMTSGTLYDAVSDAYDAWQATEPSVFEAAEAYLGQHDSSTTSNIFLGAKKTFKFMETPTLLPGMPPTHYAWTEAPENWWKKGDITGFSHIKLESSHGDSSSSDDYWSSGGFSGLDFGLFSVGVHFTKTTDRQFMQTSTEHLVVDFYTMRVDIRRDWFLPSLLAIKNWRLDSYGPGTISTGSIGPNNTNTALPWTVNSFIVAKNITICNKWSTKEMDSFHSELDTDGGIGFNFGFFALHVGAKVEHRYDRLHSTFSIKDNCLICEDPQIIAFMGPVTPFSPPMP